MMDATQPIVADDLQPADAPVDATAFYQDDLKAADPVDPQVDPDADTSPADVEDPDAPDDAADDGDQDAGDPIPAPLSWAKEHKEKFEALPRELQEVVAKREQERDTFLQTKAREAAKTRETVEAEARQVVIQIGRNHAEQLERYANMLDIPEPDVRLLHSGDPEDHRLYMQQDADYKLVSAQRTQAQRDAENARQHAQAIEHQALQAELEREQAQLVEQLPEWSDPSRRAELVTQFKSTAAELGYSSELIEQARACDIVAVQKVAAWKAKAEKYDQMNKAKMVPVRAAKSIPPAASSGASGAGQRAEPSALELLYPDDVRR